MVSIASRRSSALVGLLLLLPSTASALDTWESYGPLAFGVDAYVRGGVDPAGGPNGEPKGQLGGWMYGFLGLGPITFYGTFEVDGDPMTGVNLVGGGPGILATPLDTPVIDLDLGFQFLFLGPDQTVLTPTPWLEFNVDFGPDQSVAGLFGRLDLPIYVLPQDGAEPTVSMDLEWTVGAYFALAKQHQLLLGWRNLAPVLPAGHVAPGEVVVGWNARAAPFLELVTELAFGIPEDDSLPTFAGTFGLEFTLGVTKP